MIFYEKIGKGKPLFLLHSGGMNHTEWMPQVPFLKEYFTLFLVDLPGHGNSLMQGAKLSIHECANGVLEVMDKEGIKDALFCGSSMGGATALWLTMHHRKRVSRLALYRSDYYKSNDTFQRTLRMGEPSHWEGLGIAQVMSKMHLGQGDKDSWKEVIQRVSQALDPTDSDHDYTLAELATIDIPVLLICGDRDPLVPMKDLIDMYNTIPGASLWILPYATHITATNTWRYEIFAQELQRFMMRSRH